LNKNFFPEASQNESPANELPALGIRNYWYPAIAAWRLRQRPRAIELLGERIVLFRDGGKAFALADRCSHRGAPLSMGKCLYPGSGTISCAYHGWTFAGESGKCVAKLMEGPSAIIPKRAAIKSYAVREFAGFIWLFVGDMEAVPLEEDMPECLSDRAGWHSIANWRTYNCNWRLLMDNLAHDQHAPFLHRTSPELIFQPIFKHATRNSAEVLDNGKGIGHVARDGISSAEYPGLGTFPPPQEAWYRTLKPVGRGKEIEFSDSDAPKDLRKYRHFNMLPSIALIGRPSGDFFTCRWITPIDEKTTILYNFNLFRRRGKFGVFLDRVKWSLWSSWAHDWLFSDQDKWVVEAIGPGKELLSSTDVGVSTWRWFALKNARRPAQPKANGAPVEQSSVSAEDATV
jgi:phenylpropionate dioxygenase-like ring-hydroxylating dioxygenase large terminal subunit